MFWPPDMVHGSRGEPWPSVKPMRWGLAKLSDVTFPNKNASTKGEQGVERVFAEGTDTLLAIIIRVAAQPTGIQFVTDDESTHQLGILRWPQGHTIDAHVHNPLSRTIDSTQEILFVRSGRVRMDLYDSGRVYQCSSELGTGDVVFLVAGGHGFEILEDADIIEVKQGPYLGEGEKTRFVPLDNPYRSDAHAPE